MQKLDLNSMSYLNGGDNITAACTGIATGSVVYEIGVLANWWNPIGWIGATALVVVNGACLIYSAKH